MKKRFFSLVVTSIAIVTLITVGFFLPSPVRADGAVQISGIGVYDDEAGVCNDYTDDYTLILDGDLKGCVYTFVTDSVSSPSGTYREWGTEIYVVSHNGKEGTFKTTYLFEAKFGDAGEIFGRCQHPIIAGSPVPEILRASPDGLTLRTTSNLAFPFRGHLSYP